MVIRRKWVWLDWTLFALYIVWFLMGIALFFGKPDEIGNPSPAIFFTTMTLCFVIPLLFWRPGYVHLVFFPLSILFTTGLLDLYSTYQAQTHTDLMQPLILLIAYHSHRRTIVWWIAIFVFGLAGMDYILIKDLNVTSWVDGLINNFILYLIGYVFHRILTSNLRMKELLEENERHKQHIEEQNGALTQYAQQIERLTLIEERNRMARELHDTIGHTFTSVIMGMDAVSYLIKPAPEQAAEKLDVLRQVTRKGLEEVRRNIHQIAPDDTDETLSIQLSSISNQFSMNTNTEVYFHATGEPFALPRHVKLTFIRCLQETLTNAKRHGQAQTVRITLVYGSDSLKLDIQDDGHGSSEISYGFGLSAMKDRLSEIQGTLHVESEDGKGTLVRCEISRRNVS